MALLTAQEPSRDGADITWDTVDFDIDPYTGYSDWFENTGKEIIIFRSLDASDLTINIFTPWLIDEDLIVAERVVTVFSDGDENISFHCGPFTRNLYNDENGLVGWQYNEGDTATCQVAIIKLP